jgi:hypothetical protein
MGWTNAERPSHPPHCENRRQASKPEGMTLPLTGREERALARNCLPAGELVSAPTTTVGLIGACPPPWA